MSKFNTQNLQIIKELAKTDFKLRYNGSVLGYVWSLLKPLLIFTILNFVFSHLFGNDPNYSLKLLTSIIIWNFFSEGTMVGMSSILSKAGILTKIYLPRWAIVIASTLNTLFTYFINLIVIGIFFAVYGFVPDFTDVLMFLMYSIWVYILIIAFSLFTAPLYVRFRDLTQIWEVVLMAGFYAAPIIYPMSTIPVKYHWAMHVNPMTFIIQHVQAVLFDKSFEVPLLPNLIYFSFLLICLSIGVIVFKFTSKKLVEKF